MPACASGSRWWNSARVSATPGMSEGGRPEYWATKRAQTRTHSSSNSGGAGARRTLSASSRPSASTPWSVSSTLKLNCGARVSIPLRAPPRAGPACADRRRGPGMRFGARGASRLGVPRRGTFGPSVLTEWAAGSPFPTRLSGRRIVLLFGQTSMSSPPTRIHIHRGRHSDGRAPRAPALHVSIRARRAANSCAQHSVNSLRFQAGFHERGPSPNAQ